MFPILEAVPLCEDGRGGYRIGDSRVPLDTVIDEFRNGADPESIMNAYPTLRVADIYSVIAYYLNHQESVDRHLAMRQAQAAELRQEIEKRTHCRG